MIQHLPRKSYVDLGQPFVTKNHSPCLYRLKTQTNEYLIERCIRLYNDCLFYKINYDKLYDSYRRLLEVVEERNSLGNFICSLEYKIYKLYSQVNYVEQNQLFKDTLQSSKIQEALRSKDLTDAVMHLPGRYYEKAASAKGDIVYKAYSVRKSEPVIGIEESQVMHLDAIYRKRNTQNRETSAEPPSPIYTYTFKKYS